MNHWSNQYRNVDGIPYKELIVEIEIQVGSSIEKVYSIISSPAMSLKMFFSAFLSYSDTRAKRITVYGIPRTRFLWKTRLKWCISQSVYVDLEDLMIANRTANRLANLQRALSKAAKGLTNLQPLFLPTKNLLANLQLHFLIAARQLTNLQAHFLWSRNQLTTL